MVLNYESNSDDLSLIILCVCNKEEVEPHHKQTHKVITDLPDFPRF